MARDVLVPQKTARTPLQRQMLEDVAVCLRRNRFPLATVDNVMKDPIYRIATKAMLQAQTITEWTASMIAARDALVAELG
ncbi:MAG: hypothetical protein ABIH03_14405 [Pseudomonadota bacterium]